MADVFKFTEDQRTALTLIGGTVRKSTNFSNVFAAIYFYTYKAVVR